MGQCRPSCRRPNEIAGRRRFHAGAKGQLASGASRSYGSARPHLAAATRAFLGFGLPRPPSRARDIEVYSQNPQSVPEE